MKNTEKTIGCIMSEGTKRKPPDARFAAGKTNGKGGDMPRGVFKRSEETLRRMSEAQKGIKKPDRSEETKNMKSTANI